MAFLKDIIKQEVEDKLKALKTAITNNDISQMQSGMTELNTVLQKLGENAYETPPETESDDQESSDDPKKTVEGDFREV